MVYLFDQNSKETIVNYFTSLNIDLTKFLDKGQLVFRSSSEVYWDPVDVSASSSSNPKAITFSPDATISKLNDTLEEALKAGYSKLRVTGEADWASRLSLEEKFFEYEHKLYNFFATKPCVALCQFDAKRFSSSCLMNALTCHPKVTLLALFLT